MAHDMCEGTLQLQGVIKQECCCEHLCVAWCVINDCDYNGIANEVQQYLTYVNANFGHVVNFDIVDIGPHFLITVQYECPEDEPMCEPRVIQL